MARVRIVGYLSELSERQVNTQWGPQTEVQARIKSDQAQQYSNLVVASGEGGKKLRELVAAQNGKPIELLVEPFGVPGAEGKRPWVKFILQADGD